MTIRQLSIFIENQSGTLQKVLELIKQLRIQIIACTIADTAEYGIFRIICSEPDRACRELKAVGVAVAISDVFAVELDDGEGSPRQRLRDLSNSSRLIRPSRVCFASYCRSHSR